LRPVIERVTGNRMQVIDSGTAVARRTHSVLDAEALFHPSLHASQDNGELRVLCSGDPVAFSKVASKILGYNIVAQQVEI
jgi:glutamate racemase